MDLADIYKHYKSLASSKEEIKIIARVRSNRSGKNISFIVINDGSIIKDLQVVYKKDISDYELIQKIRNGSIIEVQGVIVLSTGKLQDFELIANNIVSLDQAVEDYPLQKKEHSVEFLREIAHLRARTKTFNSIYRIRSIASFGFHKFFQEKNFVYVQTPILTGNDAEGAGETFIVTTSKDNQHQNDFFGKKAVLTVSGQLHAEAFAQSFKNVYTFGPTFRAEESYTSKHAAEFWMIEPEVAFNDLQNNIKLIHSMLKSVTEYVQKKCFDELVYLSKHFGIDVKKRCENLTKDYVINTYEEVINKLQKVVEEGHKFQNNDIYFGLDLGTEHERYLCEVINKVPTFVINYPKEIKSFYMKENEDGKTVAAVDLLVPEIGELVGGSERECDYETIIKRCLEQKIDIKTLEWYNNLRKFGYYKSAGFGLGFERYLMYITGANNIRDVLPYPRTPKNLFF